MSAIKECQKYHLTPHGWVIGSFKGAGAAGGSVTVPTPKNRVLTIGCYEELAAECSKPTRTKLVLWESDDRQAVQKLKKQYGVQPPARLEKSIAPKLLTGCNLPPSCNPAISRYSNRYGVFTP